MNTKKFSEYLYDLVVAKRPAYIEVEEETEEAAAEQLEQRLQEAQWRQDYENEIAHMCNNY